MPTRTVTIRPGERIILPTDAQITSVVTEGDITVVSTCNNLPDPSSYACGTFVLTIDKDTNDSHPMDEQNTYFDTLFIGDTVIPIGVLVIASGEDPGTLQSITTLNSFIDDSALFQFTSIVRTDTFDKRQYITVTFEAPEDLFDNIEMKVVDRGITVYYKANLVDCA